jgi:hypothetical protein
MASSLLDSKHNTQQVEEVLRRLRNDDKAYFDAAKKVRKVPVFQYDHEGNPIRITHWNERRVTENWAEAVNSKGTIDFYHETRGWVRGGKKNERDYDYKPDPLELE